MNQYEIVFIFTPVLPQNEVEALREQFTGFLAEHGGEIVNDEPWGLKDLAYPIRKKTTGIYQLFEFKVNPLKIEELETICRRDDRIMRFVITKLEKDAIEYNVGRRVRLKSKKSEPANA